MARTQRRRVKTRKVVVKSRLNMPRSQWRKHSQLGAGIMSRVKAGFGRLYEGILSKLPAWNFLNVRRFSIFISHYNAAKKEMDSMHDRTKADANIILKTMENKTKLLTGFLNTTKELTIYKHISDKYTPAEPVKQKSVMSSIATLDKKVKIINTRLDVIKDDIDKKAKPYEKSVKLYTDAVDKYDKVISKYSDLMKYIYKLKQLETEYAEIKTIKEKDMSKEQKTVVKEYSKRKQEIERVNTLSDAKIDELNKSREILQNSMKSIEFARGQITTELETSKVELNKILGEWSGNENTFYKNLTDLQKSLRGIKSLVDKVSSDLTNEFEVQTANIGYGYITKELVSKLGQIAEMGRVLVKVIGTLIEHISELEVDYLNMKTTNKSLKNNFNKMVKNINHVEGFVDYIFLQISYLGLERGKVLTGGAGGKGGTTPGKGAGGAGGTTPGKGAGKGAGGAGGTTPGKGAGGAAGKTPGKGAGGKGGTTPGKGAGGKGGTTPGKGAGGTTPPGTPKTPSSLKDVILRHKISDFPIVKILAETKDIDEIMDAILYKLAFNSDIYGYIDPKATVIDLDDLKKNISGSPQKDKLEKTLELLKITDKTISKYDLIKKLKEHATLVFDVAKVKEFMNLASGVKEDEFINFLKKIDDRYYKDKNLFQKLYDRFKKETILSDEKLSEILSDMTTDDDSDDDDGIDYSKYNIYELIEALRLCKEKINALNKESGKKMKMLDEQKKKLKVAEDTIKSIEADIADPTKTGELDALKTNLTDTKTIEGKLISNIDIITEELDDITKKLDILEDEKKKLEELIRKLFLKLSKKKKVTIAPGTTTTNNSDIDKLISDFLAKNTTTGKPALLGTTIAGPGAPLGLGGLPSYSVKTVLEKYQDPRERVKLRDYSFLSYINADFFNKLEELATNRRNTPPTGKIFEIAKKIRNLELICRKGESLEEKLLGVKLPVDKSIIPTYSFVVDDAVKTINKEVQEVVANKSFSNIENMLRETDKYVSALPQMSSNDVSILVNDMIQQLSVSDTRTLSENYNTNKTRDYWSAAINNPNILLNIIKDLENKINKYQTKEYRNLGCKAVNFFRQTLGIGSAVSATSDKLVEINDKLSLFEANVIKEKCDKKGADNPPRRDRDNHRGPGSPPGGRGGRTRRRGGK